jgi:ribokinase
MSVPFDVIVCGSLHLDVMVYAPSLPRLDETVVGSRWSLGCGGKGGNQAVMAARAGARAAMIGRVGADQFGVRLRGNLAAASVDISAVHDDAAAASGMSAAIVRDDGEYGAVIVSGANLRIEPTAIGEAWRALAGASILVLQNEIPEAANIAAARVDLNLSLDTSSRGSASRTRWSKTCLASNRTPGNGRRSKLFRIPREWP